MALTGAERAVQVRRTGAAGLHRGLDDAESFVEALGKLLGHHVVGDCGLVLDTLGQGEDEIPGVYPVWDDDQVTQQRRCRALAGECFLCAHVVVSPPSGSSGPSDLPVSSPMLTTSSRGAGRTARRRPRPLGGGFQPRRSSSLKP